MALGRKTGGRKKGSLNKLALTVAARLEELGHDPIRGMIAVAQDAKLPRDLRLKADIELTKYVYPQRKAVEHSGLGGGAIEILNVTGTEVLLGRLAGIAARRRAGIDSSKSE